MKFTSTVIAFALAATAGTSDAFSPAVVRNTASTTTSLDAKRQPIMAGNWKMNPCTEHDAIDLSQSLTKLLGEETCPIDDENPLCTEVVVFPPHPFISKVSEEVADAGITIGAQSIYFEDAGAYTGSVSASMVRSLGCEYVLCGHSERRTLFDDDDQAINRKVLKVLTSGMKPILCIGESKAEYDLHIKNEVCAMQLSKDLANVTKEQMKEVVIAYEPVWAIGTGLVCAAGDASKFNSYHTFAPNNTINTLSFLFSLFLSLIRQLISPFLFCSVLFFSTLLFSLHFTAKLLGMTNMAVTLLCTIQMKHMLSYVQYWHVCMMMMLHKQHVSSMVVVSHLIVLMN
jgi:triosephosphate isomerase